MPDDEGDPEPDPLGPQAAAARARMTSRRPIGRYIGVSSEKGDWVGWTWHKGRWFR
jgi:hypothetical protein